MKKFLLLFLLLFLFSQIAVAGEFHFDIGAGYSRMPLVELRAANPVAIFRISYEIKGLSLEYQHESSLTTGPPFNLRVDDRWQERVAIIYRFK